MFFPSKQEFIKLSGKGNLIPVCKEISGDLETPVSAFLKLSAKSDYSYLLESVEGQEKIARFSFLAYEPMRVIVIKGKRLEILYRGAGGRFEDVKFIDSEDPFQAIKEIMSAFTAVKIEGFPKFCGGLVGYIGYGMVRFFEDVPEKNPDTPGIADSIFLLSDTLLVFDHLKHRVKIISCAYLKDKSPAAILKAYNKSTRRIDEIIKALKEPAREAGARKGKKLEVSFATKRRAFLDMVRRAKEYIRKGDIIQVVLSQVLTARSADAPFNIYRKLRSLNPSAYMFYLKLKDLHLIGSSPEMLVRCEDGLVTTRPIAGTRPRGSGDEEDKRLERELLADKKERAEHIMLVDLGRNDLGRVCRFGSVKVLEFMRIERYSHVMHIVSEVQGRLRRGKDVYDVLRACFPAGTVTGSPKVRAMEIIDELESSSRGPYAGAVGYFSFSGNLDTCITIRTIVVNKGIAYVQAGAGIVADSLAESEYQETLNKAKAQLEAL
ncbi:anthranilate synthase component I [bacterium]|nr:MAG: anthranilate synthase component I [bacterium]